MRNIIEQFSLCRKSSDLAEGSDITFSARVDSVISTTYPLRNRDGRFLADTSGLLRIGQDVDLALVQVGRRGGRAEEENRIGERRMDGKE